MDGLADYFFSRYPLPIKFHSHLIWRSYVGSNSYIRLPTSSRHLQLAAISHPNLRAGISIALHVIEWIAKLIASHCESHWKRTGQPIFAIKIEIFVLKYYYTNKIITLQESF